MDTSRLAALGLTPIEARTYVALLELGGSRAGVISHKTGVNRTTTYDALERLIQKGLVSISSEGERRVYCAVAPSRLLEWVEEKKEIASELIPELETLCSKIEAPTVKIYRSKKGINSMLSQILTMPEYVSFGASGEFWEVMQHDYFAFQRKKRKAGVKSRTLLSLDNRTATPIKSIYGKFKFLPSEFFSPSSTWVFGNNVAIVTWTQPPLAVVISDKNVAKSYKSYFEAMWKIAKI
ncbi:MAG: helix-turn-helix domain-containing protein [Candidatus Micrarchaeota archaeon]